ncbi:hypothetical protein PIB30_024803 [Stylosanthes scabra]|uniref:Uncharacterized protein n=1 Tax=Stylosanthes scabra TaxID=79078 RepID=A0ABU6WBR0_9FABA|nr:hypothetical protein [Stylosanthes scabra]
MNFVKLMVVLTAWPPEGSGFKKKEYAIVRTSEYWVAVFFFLLELFDEIGAVLKSEPPRSANHHLKLLPSSSSFMSQFPFLQFSGHVFDVYCRHRTPKTFFSPLRFQRNKSLLNRTPDAPSRASKRRDVHHLQPIFPDCSGTVRSASTTNASD